MKLSILNFFKDTHFCKLFHQLIHNFFPHENKIDLAVLQQMVGNYVTRLLSKQQKPRAIVVVHELCLPLFSQPGEKLATGRNMCFQLANTHMAAIYYYLFPRFVSPPPPQLS